MGRFVLFALCFAMWPSAAAAQRDQRIRMLVERFEQAVALYRQGEFERARTQLVQLTVDEQRTAAEALLQRERTNAAARGALAHNTAESIRIARAAGALEMEAAAEEVREWSALGGGETIRLHIAIAADLFDYVAERTGRPEPIAERWLTAIGRESLSRGQFALAPAVLGPACGKKSDYAPLLLTCAIAHESASVMSYDTASAIGRNAAGTLARAQARRERSAHLTSARHFFERSLAFGPGDGEAAMRLGNVRLRMGHQDAGIAMLLSVATRKDVAARVTYLAKMFLGRAYESHGRLDDAQQAYSDALAVGQTQSVLLALSHNAQLQGRKAEAATLAERAATKILARDPWWAYAFGQYWLYTDLFAALRQEAIG